MLRNGISTVTIAIGALSVAACGGQSGSIPGSGAPVPSYAAQNGTSRSVSPQGGVAPAQTQEAVLHSFNGGSDGVSPNAGLTVVNGALYGTTISGGAKGLGTVFEITASGAESVIHSFTGGSDGSEPYSGLTDVNGVLYGTTSVGGSKSEGGTVFEITTSGAETVLHRFSGRSDGVFPFAGLTNVNGVLYGTTSQGGTGCNESGCGTVFSITTSGVESLLYEFAGGRDGSVPLAALTNVDGVLYGTTAYGGGSSVCGDGCGTVFKITTSGAENVLHSFGGDSDGESPTASLTNVNGALYGTTCNGGTSGNGAVFKTTTSGTEDLLHSFGGGSDGRCPGAGLTNINGVLYGTTLNGGVEYNTGTVFKITTLGAKGAVYRFVGGTDGQHPNADLTYLNGALYGTTADGGGAKDYGTVFSLSL